MKTRALQYYLHDGPSAFRFELSGDLDRQGARRLDQDWQTAASTLGDRRLIADLTFLTSVDEAGRALLVGWHRGGAHIVANCKSSRAIAESILGAPLRELPADTPAAAASNRTWIAFRGSVLGTASVTLWLLLVAFASVTEISGATLKSETVAAWNDYLEKANAELQDRVRPGGAFLWTLENAELAARVQSGEIVVVPASGQSPKKVPGGLIHHWMGTMFMPNVRLDDILTVTNDYDHYKDFFRSSVVDSKTLPRSAVNDKFAMLLMNKAFLLKTALEGSLFLHFIAWVPGYGMAAAAGAAFVFTMNRPHH